MRIGFGDLETKATPRYGNLAYGLGNYKHFDETSSDISDQDQDGVDIDIEDPDLNSVGSKPSGSSKGNKEDTQSKKPIRRKDIETIVTDISQIGSNLVVRHTITNPNSMVNDYDGEYGGEYQYDADNHKQYKYSTSEIIPVPVLNGGSDSIVPNVIPTENTLREHFDGVYVEYIPTDSESGSVKGSGKGSSGDRTPTGKKSSDSTTETGIVPYGKSPPDGSPRRNNSTDTSNSRILTIPREMYPGNNLAHHIKTRLQMTGRSRQNQHYINDPQSSRVFNMFSGRRGQQLHPGQHYPPGQHPGHPQGYPPYHQGSYYPQAGPHGPGYPPGAHGPHIGVHPDTIRRQPSLDEILRKDQQLSVYNKQHSQPRDFLEKMFYKYVEQSLGIKDDRQKRLLFKSFSDAIFNKHSRITKVEDIDLSGT